MNGTADYKMNPAEDTLLSGDQLTEGMWVLAECTAYRIPSSAAEDDRLWAQRFRRVSGLRREGTLVRFTGTWVDGYAATHTSNPGETWIVKKAPAPEVTATVSKGDVIRIVPEKGPERVMVVAHVEHHVITLADLPTEREAAS